MLTTLTAAIRYFLLVFAAGFVFGTIRTLTTADTPDARLMAVVVELPAILVVSWLACAHATRRYAVPPTTVERLAMGGLAFALLMLAELLLDVVLAGKTAREHFEAYAEASHQLGLAGQAVFALIPLIQSKRHPS